MSRITFRKIDQEEALIYHDGELVGDLYLDQDPLTGRPVYVYHPTMSCDLVLSCDFRYNRMTIAT